MSLLGLIMSSPPYLRSAMVWFPLVQTSWQYKGGFLKGVELEHKGSVTLSSFKQDRL